MREGAVNFDAQQAMMHQIINQQQILSRSLNQPTIQGQQHAPNSESYSSN